MVIPILSLIELAMHHWIQVEPTIERHASLIEAFHRNDVNNDRRLDLDEFTSLIREVDVVTQLLDEGRPEQEVEELRKNHQEKLQAMPWSRDQTQLQAMFDTALFETREDDDEAMAASALITTAHT
jgi:septum formation inhibitor MinC